MTKYEAGQEIWVQGIVTETDEADILDIKVEFQQGDGRNDHVWLKSSLSYIKTQAPEQPKPPAPVRLFGRTIFDLINAVEIEEIWQKNDNQQWCVQLKILRGNHAQTVYFFFPTKEEAEAARELIEKEVLKAKGIIDHEAQ